MSFWTWLFGAPKPEIETMPAPATPVATPHPLDLLPAAIRAVAPSLSDADVQTWATALAPPMRSSGIVTARRAGMFIGQCAVESVGFAIMVEDLDYSAERLCQVWPTHFPDIAAAQACAGNPEGLANEVYAGRLGNGDPASGDGWRFRGGGLIQITGRYNYQRFADAVRQPIDQAAAWVRTPAGAAASACWYWSNNRINGWADDWKITVATRIINGSLQGIGDRIAACNAALKAFGGY